MTAAGASLPSNASCPRCGAAFRCGMVGGDAECWCVKLPHVMPVPSSNPSSSIGTSEASCFCAACLQKITDDRQPDLSPARD
ncbi:MAG: cysteine-rich CWC family protein [Polaromonas sp.]|uniref:cysteine-rich CWC family protein n=1 Tax=Polaromonas sp. TaxID=1869339 RepID=UPI00248737CA|nr:cysteine-rich CWC family protein [Polaromonas sp.]MDI1236263.1 cysteine-rich CWC family protein [Polaromonas sp.]